MATWWGTPNSFDPAGGIDPNWEAPPQSWSPWDTAEIGGIKVPGLVKVKGRKEQRVDKKRALGPDGATPTMLGFNPVQIEVTVLVWTQAQYTQLGALIDSLHLTLAQAKAAPKGSPINAAVVVSHPALTMARISSLYLKSFTLPEPTGSPQQYSMGITLEEFNPQKNQSPKTNTGTKMTASAPSVYGTTAQPKPPELNPTFTGPNVAPVN